MSRLFGLALKIHEYSCHKSTVVYRSMGCGMTELYMLAAIFACVFYLYLPEDEGIFQTPTADHDFINETYASEGQSETQRLRASNLNIFVLSVTFPRAPTVNFNKDDADALLEALFNVRLENNFS